MQKQCDFNTTVVVPEKEKISVLTMSSTVKEIQIVGRNGEVLSATAVDELKTAFKCETLLRGEAPEETYRAAIERFNKAVIEEAVSSDVPSLQLAC